MLLPSVAYMWLQSVIRRTGKQGPAAEAYYRQLWPQGQLRRVAVPGGHPLTFLSPWLGITCAGLVAILWFLPEGPLDRLFEATGWTWGGVTR